MTTNDDDDITDLTSERDRLMDECMRLRIERETGVPAGMMASATTEAEARALAEQALEWRATAPPALPTAAVRTPTYSVGQISKGTLPYLSPADTMAAWRAGRLEQAGCPAPPERRSGQHHGP